jgi:type VI secretion system VasD/TssJ family lipoprotein
MNINRIKHFRPYKRYIIPVLALWIFFPFGCSSKIKYISLEATQDLNKGGNACYVCIYQLRNDMDFKRTPVESFWIEGEKPFEADIVEKPVCETLIPGDEAYVDITVSDETNFIGVAADFREPDPERWRQVYAIPSKKPKEVRIIVGSNTVRIEAY